MMGRAAGAGLPANEEFLDTIDVLSAYLADVLLLGQVLWMTGASHGEINELVDTCAQRFMIDVGYGEMALEIDEMLEKDWM